MMGKVIDITGQRFGKLVVVSRHSTNDKYKTALWLCQCDCGNTTVVRSRYLREGETKSCGCLTRARGMKQFSRARKIEKGEFFEPNLEMQSRRGGKKPADLTGQKFGVLTAVIISGKGNKGETIWLCDCECGGSKNIRANDLRMGKIKSCGCLRAKKGRDRKPRSRKYVKHGERYSAAYRSWGSMLQRCENPKQRHYYLYGGRGITVCSGWHIFENFFFDMGPRPQKRSIDRINNDDGYHCGHCEDCKAHGWVANCRWATQSQQLQNTRRSKHITVDGKRMSLKEASLHTGISYDTLQQRLRKGWTDEETLSVPYRCRKP